MECNLCHRNDVEFYGNKKVCNECQALIAELNKTKKHCEYCGDNEDNKKFSKAQKGVVCKDCKPQYTLDLKKERHRLCYAEYYEKNKEAIAKKSRDWNKNNKDKRAKSKKAYRDRHKNEINFRIKENLSTRLRNIMNKDGHPVIDYMECSIEFFKCWLEFNFKDGMTFENYGSYWHVDHAKPCALFDHSKIEEVKECWHWSNLVPLESLENASKGHRLDEDYINYYRVRKAEFLESLSPLEWGSETKWLSAKLNSLKI